MNAITSHNPILNTVTARLRVVLVSVGAIAFGLVAGACDSEDSEARYALVAVDDGDSIELVDDGDAAPGPVEEFLVEEFSAQGPEQAAGEGDACEPDTIEEEGGCGDPGTEKLIITNCYCGTYNGSALYVGVSCAGFPGTDVCCATKCGELTAALDSQV